MLPGGRDLWRHSSGIPPPDILLAYLPTEIRPPLNNMLKTIQKLYPALKGEAYPVVIKTTGQQIFAYKPGKKS
jgi:hypothetical protein